MICTPCREPHQAADCVDVAAGRVHPWRHCVCQHQPYINDPSIDPIVAASTSATSDTAASQPLSASVSGARPDAITTATSPPDITEHGEEQPHE